MHVVAGKSHILMLDAEKRAAEFWSTTADDITMRQTTKNFHSCSAYEESRLRAVQRIQGNFIGKYRSLLFYYYRSILLLEITNLKMMKQINRQIYINILLHSGINIIVLADVHVRELRSAIIWRSISEM